MPRLILIGPPGSGKSTIGKAVASRLKVDFVDTDSVIEHNYGAKISDIFVDKGESFFRELEFTVLQECLTHVDCVLALGGGAPISQRAQLLLKESSYPIVFLNVSLAVAAPRVGFNRDRPLLLGNPRAQWQALAQERAPIYQALASFSITVDGMSVAELVNEIVEKIS